MVISVRVPDRVECVFTSPVRTECGMFVMCCMQCCMSMHGCTVSWRYIDDCNCVMFNVVLSLCGVCSHVIVFGLSVRLSWYPM